MELNTDEQAFYDALSLSNKERIDGDPNSRVDRLRTMFRESRAHQLRGAAKQIFDAENELLSKLKGYGFTESEINDAVFRQASSSRTVRPNGGTRSQDAGSAAFKTAKQSSSSAVVQDGDGVRSSSTDEGSGQVKDKGTTIGACDNTRAPRDDQKIDYSLRQCGTAMERGKRTVWRCSSRDALVQGPWRDRERRGALGYVGRQQGVARGDWRALGALGDCIGRLQGSGW